MPKKKKEDTVVSADSNIDAEIDELLEEDSSYISPPPPPPGIDIAKAVDSVRGRYGKKDKGFSSDITTGDKIKLSDDDDDYIISDRLNWWLPLTGIKGIPFGRIVQIAGKSDSGKTTTVMLAMVAAQYQGTVVVLWDSEGKFDMERFKTLGGAPEYVLLTTSRNVIRGIRDVLKHIKEVKSQNPDVKILLVWDSVGATLNDKEDDEDVEDDDYSKQPGVTAKEISWGIRRLNKIIERFRQRETGKHTIAIACTNQVYANIGSVGFKEKGGETLFYMCSLILQLSRKKDLSRVSKGQKYKYGIVSRAKVRKNHLFSGRECVAELDLVVGADGIQLAKEVKGRADIVGWDEDEE